MSLAGYRTTTSAQGSTATAVPAKRPRTEAAAPSRGMSLAPNCPCDVPTVLLTVKKVGPNTGRKFYKCDSRNGGQGCNFFEWADRPAGRQRNSASQAPKAKRVGQVIPEHTPTVQTVFGSTNDSLYNPELKLLCPQERLAVLSFIALFPSAPVQLQSPAAMAMSGPPAYVRATAEIAAKFPGVNVGSFCAIGGIKRGAPVSVRGEAMPYLRVQEVTYAVEGATVSVVVNELDYVNIALK